MPLSLGHLFHSTYIAHAHKTFHYYFIPFFFVAIAVDSISRFHYFQCSAHWQRPFDKERKTYLHIFTFTKAKENFLHLFASASVFGTHTILRNGTKSPVFYLQLSRKNCWNIQEMFKYFRFDGHNYLFKYLLEFILYHKEVLNVTQFLPLSTSFSLALSVFWT